MTVLREAIKLCGERLDKYRRPGQRIGEQNTKAMLIEPVLHALGWDLFDPDEVNREYRRRSSDNPVDYALLLLRTPRLFVEAKGLGENLDDPRWANQTISYAAVAGVEWIALTNGAQWRIYNAHAPVPVEDKPPADLVSLVAKRTERLGKDEVRASLIRARATFDFPLPTHAPLVSTPVPGPAQVPVPAHVPQPQEPASPIVGPALAGKPAQRTAKPRVSSEERGIKVNDLLRSGRLLPGPLYSRYDGKNWEAELTAAGEVLFRREVYPSLSTAGSAVKKAARGPGLPKSVLATDGWDFWSARDAVQGDVVPLKLIRRRWVQR